MTDVAPNPELDQVHAQLLQVDKVLQREMAKEAQMDQLMTRLNLVHQQLLATWSGPPYMAGVGALQALAARVAPKKAQKKPKPKPKAGVCTYCMLR